MQLISPLSYFRHASKFNLVIIFFLLFVSTNLTHAQSKVKKHSFYLPLLKFPESSIDKIRTYNEIEAVYAVLEQITLDKPNLHTEYESFPLYKHYTKYEKHALRKNGESVPFEDMSIYDTGETNNHTLNLYLGRSGQAMKIDNNQKEHKIDISNGRFSYEKTDCKNKGGVNRAMFETPYTAGKLAVLIRHKKTKEVFHAEIIDIHGSIDTLAAECTQSLDKKHLRKVYVKKRSEIYDAVANSLAHEQELLVRKVIQENILFGIEKVHFKVAYAKSKKYDYSELEKAFQLAETSYERYKNDGINAASLNEIEKAVKVWELFLKESDLGDKKAKVNLKVTRALHNNLRMAYAVLLDYEKSLYHERKAAQIKNMMQVSFEPQFLNLQRTFHNNSGWGQIETNKLASLYKESLNESPVIIKKQSADNFPTLANKAKDFLGKTANIARTISDAAKPNQATSNDTATTAVTSNTSDSAEGLASHVIFSPFEGHMIHMYGGFGSDYPQYTSLPEDVCELTHLKNIKITSNQIAEVPTCISNLTSLETLNLKNNKLKDFPMSITKLSSLKKLDLSDNQFTTIPDEIAKLANLKKLVLKGNNFSKEKIKSLKKILPKKCKLKH